MRLCHNWGSSQGSGIAACLRSALIFVGPAGHSAMRSGVNRCASMLLQVQDAAQQKNGGRKNSGARLPRATLGREYRKPLCTCVARIVVCMCVYVCGCVMRRCDCYGCSRLRHWYGYHLVWLLVWYLVWLWVPHAGACNTACTRMARAVRVCACVRARVGAHVPVVLVSQQTYV